MPSTEVTITDRNGETHVFLDALGDDHIVTKFVVRGRGESASVMLPRDEWAWDRAVVRAQRAAAFL